MASKDKEARYLKEAREASSIFPVGELILHEKPDFLLHADRGKIGIEVTELMCEEQKAEGGWLAKVGFRAQEHYSQMPNTCPVNVTWGANAQSQIIGFDQLTKRLADFVHAHQDTEGLFEGEDCGLPDGYSYIAINKPRYSKGAWRIGNAFGTRPAPRELLEARIRKKNQRLPDYRWGLTRFGSSLLMTCPFPPGKFLRILTT